MKKVDMDELFDLWCKEDKYCMLHPTMQCAIILCPDGSTYAHYDVAGSNFVPGSVWDKTDTILFTMCYQYVDLENDLSLTSFETWLDDHDIDYDHDMDCKSLRECLYSDYDVFREEIADDIVTEYDTPYTLAEKLRYTPIAAIAHAWAYGRRGKE